MRLELHGITKRFGDFTANDAIDMVVEPGQIHAILGENGAGKSTLMNVLYGLYRPEEGEILIDDQPVTFEGPGEAMRAGIGMVHQHFMLVPVFTVAENVALGYEPTKATGLIDAKMAHQVVTRTADRFGFRVDPKAVVEDLPVGVQQRVEIIKALSRDAQILILDEPTAVLTPQETDELIEIMRQLKAAGTSILFITHKLREVKAVADTITVIRHGQVVGTADPSASEGELASLMVGRSVSLGVERAPADPGEVGLEVKGLKVVDGAGVSVVDGVDLQVKRGEIVGIAGVQGNGQTEITEAILGIQAVAAGSIYLDGKDISTLSVRNRLEAGLGFIPEDRSTDGVIAAFPIQDNLVLDILQTPTFSRFGAINRRAVRDNARARVEEFDVRTRSVTAPASTLSGGNQQKVVLARELSRPLRLFVASQPTRGLDVGSIEFVHSRLVAERDAGTAVVVVSTELDEILALSDRIAVMFEGRIVGMVPAGTDRDVLGLMMAGVPPQEAATEAAEHPTELHEVVLEAEPGMPQDAAPAAPPDALPAPDTAPTTSKEEE